METMTTCGNEVSMAATDFSATTSMSNDLKDLLAKQLLYSMPEVTISVVGEEILDAQFVKHFEIKGAINA